MRQARTPPPSAAVALAVARKEGAKNYFAERASRIMIYWGGGLHWTVLWGKGKEVRKRDGYVFVSFFRLGRTNEEGCGQDCLSFLRDLNFIY